MSDELEARLRKIEDYQEIANLQARYSFLIDDRQLDLLIELFADDFVWEAGYKRMTTVTSKLELLHLLKSSAESTPMTRHLPVTPYIEVDGDKARGTWYIFGMLTAVSTEGEEARWVQGKYDNEYVRVNATWKFSRLSFTYNFLTPYEAGWVKTPHAAFWSDGGS